MALLESEIYNRVIEVGKKAVVALQNNDLDNCDNYAEQGWQLFPEPKENWNQGYNYAKSFFKGAFKISPEIYTASLIVCAVTV